MTPETENNFYYLSWGGIIIVFFFVGLFFGYQLAQLASEAKKATNSFSDFRWIDGALCSMEDETECFYPEKEISFLVEKRQCDEAGGEFYITADKIYIEYQGIRSMTGSHFGKYEIEISCTKPYVNGNIIGTETIFKYEIK